MLLLGIYLLFSHKIKLNHQETPTNESHQEKEITIFKVEEEIEIEIQFESIICEKVNLEMI